MENADFLCLKRKSSLVAVETQDVGDAEKKTKVSARANTLTLSGSYLGSAEAVKQPHRVQ